MILRISLCWLIGLILLIGCRPDPVELTTCALVEHALSSEQAVFLDLCFGLEFGERQARIRKWTDEVRLWVPVPDPELEAELEQIMAEINALSETITLRRVADSASSNLLVYFGDKAGYAATYEPEAQGLISSNFGLFSATWNTETFEITRGTVCVDRVREPDLDCQRHLLREELTQVLGLMNDTEQYPASIFHAAYTCTMGYSERDERFLRDFLSPQVETGMCEAKVVAALF